MWPLFPNSYDDMVQCDTKTCQNWFHYKCAGLNSPTDSLLWFVVSVNLKHHQGFTGRNILRLIRINHKVGPVNSPYLSPLESRHVCCGLSLKSQIPKLLCNESTIRVFPYLQLPKNKKDRSSCLTNNIRRCVKTVQSNLCCYGASKSHHSSLKLCFIDQHRRLSPIGFSYDQACN